MTDFTARPVEPYEYDTWDEFVASSPQGSLFHTSSWKRLVDLAYEPARLLLLGCFDSHSLLGGCVALDRSRCGQRTAVTPLLAPYVGYLLEVPPGEKLSDQVSRQEDIVSALASWMNQAFAYQNLINAPHLEDTRALQRSGYSLTPRFTYHINLKLPAEELWQRLDGSVRRQIRKAEKVEFVLCDMLDAPGAYSLFSGTFSRQGESCPVSRELFDAVVGVNAGNEHSIS